MSNHLSTDVYLQMVGVGRVCASVLILFAFASLSVYRSLTAVGILHTRAVTHQSCYLWLLLMAEPVCLVTEPGPITKGFLGARAPPEERASGQSDQPSPGLIIWFPVRPVQAELLDPRVWVG